MTCFPKDLKKRPITSLFVFISFIYLIPTGILVFIADPESNQFSHIAGATHWTAAGIFVVSAVIHIILNWKAMKLYMIKKASSELNFKKEFTFVLFSVTLLMIIAGTYELIFYELIL